ncbi:MAG: DUF5681 domain-containing protein [Solidesulfovibrio sp.]|uniref:DUF5681 domain-containing protein n=1 Tax=Solidesulfovibrio sp. TaxID=2910990 RepID=UPI0031596AE8
MSDKSQGKQKRLPSTAWRPGESGNPRGCPSGSRHRVTKAIQELLDGEAEALTRKAVEKALDGDMVALRLCMERICPAPKDRPVRLTLPPMTTPDDLPRLTESLLAAVADGTVTPSEAAGVAALIEGHRRALEASDLEKRITALEAKGASAS